MRDILNYINIGIVLIFLIEIILRLFAFGWNLFKKLNFYIDIAMIVVSFLAF